MSDRSTSSERVVSALEDRRLFMLLMMVASAIVLIWTESYGMWGDIDHYYVNAGDVLDGKMPYSESEFEYPPLSLVFMLIPRILTWDLNSFHYGCAALTYVFIVIGSHFLTRMADEHIGCRWQTRLMLLCTVIFGSYFVIARNDVYPAVIAIIALWFYMDRRYAPAFIVMSLAAMTKMYPALFLIPMLIPFILKRDWRDLGTALVCIAAVGLIVEAPFLLTDPDTAFAYLTYHSDRGIQVESVASSFFMVFDMVFPGDLTVEFGYGSNNITGMGSDVLAPYMNVAMGAALLAFFLIMTARIAKADMDEGRVRDVVCLMCVAMLMLFIAFSKVYSAQYLIWIMLALPLTQMSCFDRADRRAVIAVMIPFGLFSVFSYVGYTGLGLPELDPLAVCFTALKNAFHVLLTLVVLRMCWRETVAEDGVRVPARVIPGEV